MQRETKFDSLIIGTKPFVVGAISSAATLTRHDLSATLRLDIAEFRLDLTGPVPGWENRARQLRDAGKPVLLTIRSSQEGGRWTLPEDQRLRAYSSALQHASAIDVEINSAIIESVAQSAHAAGKPLVGSFHDFAGTPSLAQLRCIIDIGFARGADIVKIATRTETPEEIAILETLLRDRGDRLLSVLGMGSLGPESRVSLALAGSCLTYGYADETNAPGQISSAELLDRLATANAR